MTEEEAIQAEIEERCKVMEGVKCADSIKQEIAGLSLVMEACFSASKDLMRILGCVEPGDFDTVLVLSLIELHSELAYRFFDAIIGASMVQQQAANAQVTPQIIKLMDNIRRN